MFLRDLEDLFIEAEELEKGIFQFDFDGTKKSDEISEEQMESEMYPLVYGSPESDALTWHGLDGANCSALACIQSVLEQIFQREGTENFLRKMEQIGRYSSFAGMTNAEFIAGIEAENLYVSQEKVQNIFELLDSLEQRVKILCTVNRLVLYHPGAEIQGLIADDMVQLIGMDMTDADNIDIVLNDPCAAEGAGIRVNMGDFEAAWETGGRNTFFIMRR